MTDRGHKIGYVAATSYLIAALAYSLACLIGANYLIAFPVVVGATLASVYFHRLDHVGFSAASFFVGGILAISGAVSVDLIFY